MRFEHLGFAPDLVDYQQAWDHQREVHAQVVARAIPATATSSRTCAASRT